MPAIKPTILFSFLFAGYSPRRIALVLFLALFSISSFSQRFSCSMKYFAGISGNQSPEKSSHYNSTRNSFLPGLSLGAGVDLRWDLSEKFSLSVQPETGIYLYRYTDFFTSYYQSPGMAYSGQGPITYYHRDERRISVFFAGIPVVMYYKTGRWEFGSGGWACRNFEAYTLSADYVNDNDEPVIRKSKGFADTPYSFGILGCARVKIMSDAHLFLNAYASPRLSPWIIAAGIAIRLVPAGTAVTSSETKQ